MIDVNFCTNCGYKIGPELVFCPSCGKKLMRNGETLNHQVVNDAESEQIYVQECGQVYEEYSDVENNIIDEESQKPKEGWFLSYLSFRLKLMFIGIVLLGVVFISVAVIVVVGTFLDKNNGKDDDLKEPTSQNLIEIDENSTSKTGHIDDTAGDSNIEASYYNQKVQELVEAYLDAIYVQNDMDEIAKYVDDVSNYNEDKLGFYDKYYEAVVDVNSYTYETEIIENAYVVCVIYGIKLYNIETAAPSMETMVVKVSKDGNYLVHNLTKAEAYAMQESGEAWAMYVEAKGQQTLDKLIEALASDAELKEVYEIMKEISSKTN